MLHLLPICCSGCWMRIRHPEITPTLNERRLFLCEVCVRALWHLRIPSDSPSLGGGDTVSLYRYEGLIRDLIWRAKIKDDHGALDLLVERGLIPKAVATGHWADLIVAAPSSLWGRLRGRLDLASHLALALAQCVQKPTIPAPLHLYWRMSKNAQKGTIERAATGSPAHFSRWELHCLSAWSQNPSVKSGKRCSQTLRILMVDDVVTTGSTLRRVGSALTEACQLQGLRPELRALALAKSGA